MDRFREMEVFMAVAEVESFAGAARRLRLSPPAVTRAVSSLEERLGARLINRTTRSLSLTEAGARYLESSRRLLAELEEAEREAAGETATPTGNLRVTASVTFGRVALIRIVAGFLAAHPGVSASLVLFDRVVNLVEEGFDVGIRIGSLPDSSLRSRRVGSVQRLLVASPDYLAEHGAPNHPAELRAHSVIGFTGLMPNAEWRFFEDGAQAKVTLKPRLEVNDAAAAITAAESGYGITSPLCYMVGGRIRSGRLSPVLKAFWPEPAPVQIIYPHARLMAPKVRAFVDWTVPQLQSELKSLSAFDV